jgi:uncharacterized protein
MTQRSWLSFALLHLRRLFVVWLVLCLGIAFGQRRVMYLPDRAIISPEAAGLVDVTAATLTTPDAERLVVWRAAGRPGQPTILYFHGNGDALATRAARIINFQAAGYSVYLYAYRGFSGSTGTPSEPAIIADAKLAYDTLRAEGVAARDIVLYGESLGTSVATQVAVTRPARGLILEAPFTSMVDAWRQFVPFVPVRWLLRDRYETDKVIGQLAMPLLVIHGAKDRLVDVRLGRALVALAPEPKTLVILPRAAHMNAHEHGAMEHIVKFISGIAVSDRR